METATALRAPAVCRAAAEEGLCLGVSSSGGSPWLELGGRGSRPELAGKKFVTLLPDTGERYLSTALFAGLRLNNLL